MSRANHSLNRLLHETMIAPKCVEDVTLTGLALDSRKVEPGNLFAAIRGTESDGVEYVDAAIEKGAAAILVREGRLLSSPPIPVVEVANDRAAIARLAAAFFKPQPRTMVGVTGTNGKSSVVSFYRQLCTLAGRKSASIGTIGVETGDPAFDQKFAALNTSPDPISLHHMLQQCTQHDIDNVAIEASSHGLDQHRLDGVVWTATAFTNLTHDHLDYHKTEEAYLAAKMRLFLDQNYVAKRCVINADSKVSDYVIQQCMDAGFDMLTYGKEGNDFRVEALHATAEGLDATLNIFGERHEVSVPLFGLFQMENVLAALGLAHHAGFSAEDMVPHVAQLQGVTGRLEKVATHALGASLFVDYAHTPDALETILTSLRHHTQKRLHVVFGCGGNRDVEKREVMGNIAAQHADVVTITDDNPRSEDPELIRAAIMQGAAQVQGSADVQDIGDRKEAITQAVHALEAGDLLVVAGKGHETYQEVHGERTHFNDAEIIKECVNHG